jgi:hypothetical protein
MHRKGSDPENMQPEDFLCDFCHNHWSETRPMIEGHQGSLICRQCINAAFTAVVLAEAGIDSAFASTTCNVCLEQRGGTDPYWQSPLIDTACICQRCLMQAVETLEEDPEYNFVRPGGKPA